MFDPATNRWTRKRDMPEETSGGMSAVSNNKLYVVTDCQGEGCNPSNDIPRFYRYDPATDTWATLPTPPNDHEHGAAGFIGGKLYVTGGSVSATPDRSTCTIQRPINGARSHRSAAACLHGRPGV